MSKKAKYWLIGGLFSAILIFCAFAGGFFAGRNYYLTDELKTAKFIFDTYHKYYYFEQGSLPHELVDGLMDDYSSYYTKEEYELITKTSQGYRNALGIAFENDNNLKIVKVLYNSPADLAGVKENGVVTKVNGESVLTYQDFKQRAVNTFSISVDYGNGEVLYSNLKVKEFRETYVKFYDSQKEYFFGGENISLQSRDNTSVNGVSMPSDTLYISYSSFSGIANGSSNSWHSNINTSLGQFSVAMDFFKDNNKSKIILDLRGNGGGYTSILCGIASHFISSNATSNPLVLYSKNKHGEIEHKFYSHTSKKASYFFEQITILADKNSASASEALIGAILDYDADNLVKVVLQSNNGIFTTYGKGIMQDTIVNNLSGEALKLTIAEIFWPVSNISIHNKGVSKAISVHGGKIYESKNGSVEIDALNYAVNFLNS